MNQPINQLFILVANITSLTLIHSCARPTKVLAIPATYDPDLANSTAQMDKPVSSSSCWSHVLRGRPSERLKITK